MVILLLPHLRLLQLPYLPLYLPRNHPYYVVRYRVPVHQLNAFHLDLEKLVVILQNTQTLIVRIDFEVGQVLLYFWSVGEGSGSVVENPISLLFALDPGDEGKVFEGRIFVVPVVVFRHRQNLWDHSQTDVQNVARVDGFPPLRHPYYGANIYNYII